MAQTPKDFYEVLGVAYTATADEIRLNFLRLAKETHPDRNPDDPATEERFKTYTEAYQVLGNEDRRSKYDQFRAENDPVTEDFWDLVRRQQAAAMPTFLLDSSWARLAFNDVQTQTPKDGEQEDFDRAFSSFIRITDDDPMKAEYAAVLTKAFKKHPEWNVDTIYSLVIFETMGSPVQEIQQLLDTVVADNPEARKYLFKKYLQSLDNPYADNDTEDRYAVQLYAMLKADPLLNDGDLGLSVHAAMKTNPSEALHRLDDLIRGIVPETEPQPTGSTPPVRRPNISVRG